jgi:3-oxoacyl-[acyl-carrier protein] reductase
MNLDLTGKCALVCGSTQGIGRAAAIELAALGATVTLLARDEAKLVGTLPFLSTSANQKHNYLIADFNFPDQVKNALESIKHPIHILVNNSGGPPPGPALESQTDAFVKAFSNHLVCNHILVQALAPDMKKENYGRIINVISTSVKIPLRGMGVSNTIRGAVASWAKTLSVELAPFGITVNNVLPGTSMTGRLKSLIQSKAEKSGKTFDEEKQIMINEIPAGRISEPEEIASLIGFLATPAAGYINGTSIPVDGGRTGSI